MSIFFPFIILSIFSYFISLSYKISLSRSYIIVSFLLVYFYLLFGKFGLLDFVNQFYRVTAICLTVFLIFKKKIITENFKQIFLLFIIYLILIFICKDLYIYKYDDFSEYGITTKLIFYENNLPSNIDYLQKGSHHKINFISYFHYFFLKNSNQEFYESTTFLAHSFLIILLINVILSFLQTTTLKKIIIGIIIYFIIYILGPGFDRLYADSILGLCIALSLLVFFRKTTDKSDKLLLFIFICSMPMIKPNGLILILGLVVIFTIFSLVEKKIFLTCIVILAVLSNFYISKFYMYKFQNLNKDKDQHYEIHHTNAFTINSLGQANNFINFKGLPNDKYKFFKVQVYELFNNGIYHSKTFLVLNKVLKNLNINLNLIQIPINLICWFLIIFIITYFLSKKDEQKYLYLLTTLYLSFLLTYYFFLLFWASYNNLINEDHTIEISWERHLGTIILGFIIFLLIKLFKNFESLPIIFLILILSINIVPANSIRIFLPNEIVNKDIFWSKNFNNRIKIKNFSNKIKKEFEDYSNILFIFNDNNDPYFFPILKYELININTVLLDMDNSQIFLNNFNFKVSKLYVFTDKNNSYEKIKMILNKMNSNNNEGIDLTNKKSLDNFDFYEISYENNKINN